MTHSVTLFIYTPVASQLPRGALPLSLRSSGHLSKSTYAILLSIDALNTESRMLTASIFVAETDLNLLALPWHK